jgi:hypothetical protein
MFMNVASALAYFFHHDGKWPLPLFMYSVGATKESVFPWVQQTISEKEVKFC